MNEKCFECGSTSEWHFDGCLAGAGARVVEVGARRRSVIETRPPEAAVPGEEPPPGLKALLILRVGQIGAAPAYEYEDGRVEFALPIPAGL